MPSRVDFLPRRRRQQVACDLFADELVDMASRVEGVDHVIAISPGVWISMVFVGSGRIGVSGDVQPVASPSFAVARRREQSVDHLRESVWRVIRQKRADFFFRWRQTGKVQRRPSNQDQFARRRGRL